MKLNKTLLALAISAMFLTACSDDEADQALTDGSQMGASGINDAATGGLNSGAGMGGSQFGAGGAGGYGNSRLGPEFYDPNNPLSKSTIYFMLDSSQIQPDFEPVIAAHARYLASHPGQRLALEGHADERGSREYNVGLGERRAQTVRKALLLQGVSEAQINGLRRQR